ncbi:MAG: molybdopterin-binding protein [Candidatus Nanopelagicales bacterium]
MSTYGLEGALAWSQAFHVATAAGQRLPPVAARLDEAGGNVLARDLVLLTDDPACDCAAVDGFAICGEGPWLGVNDDRLRPGECKHLLRGQPIPDHTDAVISYDQAQAREASDGTLVVIAIDELTGVIDEAARPPLGTGITRQAGRARVGAQLVPAGRLVTPSVLALAAATGHDTVEIIRPPVVGTLVLGHALLSQGLPRDGRARDALGEAVAMFAGMHGARSNPPLRAPDTARLLLEHMDDANVDVLITTGSTAPTPDNHVRQVLRDLGARWLIDGVASTPGAQMLLARLPDGRLIVGLPGEPASAIAGLVTIVAPLLAGMRGAEPPRTTTATLIDEVPPGEYVEDTRLVPVHLEKSGGNTIARLLPAGVEHLGGLANADGVAVIAPGAGNRGEAVPVLPV